MWNKKLCFVMIAVLVMGNVAAIGDVVTGLEGYWPLDGSAQDFSGNELHGSLIGDAHFLDNGVHGGTLELDGDGDYISVDGYKGILQPPWTLACWLKTTTAGNLDIVSWGSEGGGLKVEFRLHDGRPRIEHGNGNNRGDAEVHDDQWHHVVAVLPEGGLMDDVLFYLDGEPLETFQVGNGTNPFITIEGIDFNIGRSGPRGDRHFEGLLDEVRIYSRMLSQDDIREMMETSNANTNPMASGPKPADGSRSEDTWVNLGWNPGVFAVSHDIYLGDDFDQVNNGTGDTFRGNQATTLYPAGFPGFAYPDGLVPGTTYYWRIDEVNDANPDSPWKGDIWSFVIPSRQAYEPDPADGAEFIDTKLILSWNAGMNAKLHYVYFGDDPDQVSNADGASSQTDTTYSPAALESGKTYYWRVDEFDGTTTHRGDLWSFTTVPEIAITDPNLLLWYKLDETPSKTAVDWSGQGNHGTLIGTAKWTVPGLIGDAAVAFGQNGYVAIRNLNYNGADYAEMTVSVWIRTTNPGEQIIAGFGRADYWRVGIDSYGAGPGLIDWDVMTDNGQVDHGSVSRVDDGFWHHVCCVFNKGFFSIYIDGRVDSTMNEGTTFGSGATRYGFLGADSLADTFDGTRDFINAFLGDIDDFRIYDKALTQDEIMLTMRGDLLVAWNPSPPNGANPGIKDALPLSFSAGDSAAEHDVYFGTDREAVKDADASDTSGIYRGRQATTNYTPAEVEWGGGPYYWRIDEYNTDGTISKGNVWSFTIADFIGIDDFESYNDLDPDDPATNRIFNVWLDGFENPAVNGSIVGYAAPPFAEQTIVHGGSQSMPFEYNNAVGKSEATLTLTSNRDWTESGVNTLVIWYMGNATNAPETMYVALNGNAVVNHNDPEAAQASVWTEWSIDLQAFADQGVNLTNVTSITLGLGNKNNPVAGGAGMMYYDDIRLYAR
ncbi:MAG: LamG domain-containing protein [Planctomycetes bacterium]|nr:LamG domain-containing protein [Planctomycetota bacterium]